MRADLQSYNKAFESQTPNHFQTQLEPSCLQVYSLPYPTTHRNPYEPSFPHYHKPPPLTSITQTSGLDAFLTFPNMDNQTLALKRIYDELKGQQYELFMLREANQLSKEMEERLAKIEDFIKAFVQHVRWKKTNGEEGALWPYDPNNGEGIEEQELNASQVDDSQSPIPILTQDTNKDQASFQLPEESPSHFGNIPPLLEEVNPPHTTMIVDVSNDEVDEEIVVESPQMFDCENAHYEVSNSSCVVDDITCITYKCDDHDVSLSASNDDDLDFDEPPPCSCGDDNMCMDCIDLKYDKFVALHKKNFSEAYDASISVRNDIDDIMENDALSLNAQNVEKCEQSPSSSSVDKHDLNFFEFIEHDGEFISPSSPHSSFICTCECDGPCATCIEIDVWLSTSHDVNSSSSLIDDISVHATFDNNHDNCSSLNPNILKNSFPASLLTSSNSSVRESDVMCSNEMNLIPSTSHTREPSNNVAACLVPTDGNQIDLLGCDVYLENLASRVHILCFRSLHVFTFRLDTAAGLVFLFQELPLPSKYDKGEGATLKKCMFLILDENFSFKRLKRP